MMSSILSQYRPTYYRIYHLTLTCNLFSNYFFSRLQRISSEVTNCCMLRGGNRAISVLREPLHYIIDTSVLRFMAARLRSQFNHYCKQIVMFKQQIDSCHLALICPCCWVSFDHPFLCSLVKLAPTPRWYVLTFQGTYM